MLASKASGARYLLLSLLVVVLDQVTKYLCVYFIEHGTMGVAVTPFFHLVHVYNHGAAFSFLAGMGGWQRWLFAALAIGIGALFVWLLLRTPRTHKWSCMAYALFIGGAVGNLIDRLIHGYVIDFLLFFIKTDDFFWAYPAFNVADIAVCVGAAILCVIALFAPKKDASTPKEPDAQTGGGKVSSKAKELPRI